MKRFLLCAMLGCGLRAEPVKMTFAQLNPLVDALQALDGHQELDADKRGVTVPYQFSGKTRAAIFRDLAACKPERDLMFQLHLAIVKAHGGRFVIAPNGQTAVDWSGAKHGEAEKAEAEAAEADSEIKGADGKPLDLTKLSPDDLYNGDANPIPGSVMTALVPILSK